MDRTTPIKTIDNSQMDNTAKQTPITSEIIQHGQKGTYQLAIYRADGNRHGIQVLGGTNRA